MSTPLAMNKATPPWYVRTLTRLIGLVLFGLVLAACVRVREAPPAAVPPEVPIALPSQCVPPTEPAGGRLLTINRRDSELRILTYRGGRLAHLGHNHIVASYDLWGYAVLAKMITASRFALCVPVESLVVDDRQLRAAAGEQFASELSDTAVSSTRRNMLAENQLNGARHPFIVVLGRIVGGEPPQVSMELELRVRDTIHTVSPTVRFEQGAQEIIASGNLEVKQTDLGIQPYTALFGALTVHDEFDIHFRVRATTPKR